MLPNPLVLLATAFIPMILGYIWFHPSLFGGESWYNVSKLHGEDRSEVSTPKLLFTIVLNFLIAFGVFGFCVHQFSVAGLVGGDAELLKTGSGAAFMADYGAGHLGFGHGAFHAVLQGWLGFAVPILGYVAIFEKKSFKYFAVYAGYWLISLALMGGCLNTWGAVYV